MGLQGSGTYVLVEDAEREYPLEPGLRLGRLELDAMLAMETLAEGSRLQKRNGGMQVVRRINGRLRLCPAGGAGRNG